MADSTASPEQHQLQEEIKAVVTNIQKSGDVSKASFEIEQGRKLIEKATKLGLPEQSYADLQRYVTSSESPTGGKAS